MTKAYLRRIVGRTKVYVNLVVFLSFHESRHKLFMCHISHQVTHSDWPVTLAAQPTRDSSVGRAEDCSGHTSPISLGRWFDSGSREASSFLPRFRLNEVNEVVSRLQVCTLSTLEALPRLVRFSVSINPSYFWICLKAYYKIALHLICKA